MRIVSVLALLAVVAAGCGGAAQPQKAAVRGVPGTLARDWEAQATAIARAASAGNGCLALQLAASLRDDVVESERRLPSRLQSPLLVGVNTLADRITCTPTPPPQGPPPDGKPKHERHGHHDHGDGNRGDQGGDG